MDKRKKILKINKKQGGLWFQYEYGNKKFVESPFSLPMFEYLTGLKIDKHTEKSPEAK